MGSRALSDALAPGWAALGAPAAGVWADPTHAVCDHALLCPALPVCPRPRPRLPLDGKARRASGVSR